jgi:sulfur relay (sulfurtransferase) DsrC/TusE family protein
MKNERYAYLTAYKEMIAEAATPPGSDAANAPEGAMSADGYMQQFKDNPKLAVYNTGAGATLGKKFKRKVFETEEEREQFLRDNKGWNKAEELEEDIKEAIKTSLEAEWTEMSKKLEAFLYEMFDNFENGPFAKTPVYKDVRKSALKIFVGIHELNKILNQIKEF